MGKSEFSGTWTQEVKAGLFAAILIAAKFLSLYIEAEVHNITIFHYIFLSFDAEFTGFFHSSFIPKSDKIVVLHYFGTNKSFFKIRVNYGRGLWSHCSFLNCPCPHLF